MVNSVRILAVGDVVGKPGRHILRDRLQGLIDLYHIDLVIANGENASGGMGITPEKSNELFRSGVDIITTGNHVWDKRDILQIIDREPALIRPANYPEGVPGKGYCFKKVREYNVCVINLQGRVFMPTIDCPFRKFDEIYDTVKDEADIIIVDLHAEATSEKKALGWYVDGRASALFGTHTHVQTSDEVILPEGTGYITDVGMTGSFNSVIGVTNERSIERFLSQIRVKYTVASGDEGINAIIFTVSGSGKTKGVKRLLVQQADC